ncbi:MAG: RNA pyrophosphohydrolase [Gammaproteobacteria bacterium]
MIDFDGYRPNVGIILSNDRGRLLWARRIGQDAWQVPQGGIHASETPEEALFRELNEELGLFPEQVQIMGNTRGLSGSERPEFDHWRWVSYWYPVRKVVPFKRKVYVRALRELAPLLMHDAQEATVDHGVVDFESGER